VRLGVLDVGSNTVHLLVVDARRGGHPTPMSSTKASLRLAEAIDSSGKLTRRGADKLVGTIDEFAKIATSSGCSELMAFATSAVRDAKNSDDVLARVKSETGVALRVLSGVDESRLTFLAVRRWYGWSAGRITNIDIESTIATARVELDNWIGHKFTDMFTLLKTEGEWKIISKVFYLHPEN